MFVTFPFVARELIPLMQAQGTERGGGRARSLGAERLADVLARHAAQHQVGPALRRDPVQRARDGRVRRGVGRLRPHPRRDQHAAAARRDPLQRVPVRGRVRGARRCSRCSRWSRWSSKTLRRVAASRATPRRSRHEHRSPQRLQALRRVRRARRRRRSTSPTGELVALLGPSGSGKTTLLRIIAGPRVARRGHACCFDGEDATEPRVRERGVGFVFQHYALFRHMTSSRTSRSACACGRARSGRAKPRSAARVHELLELVQLDWLARPLSRTSSPAASASASRSPARSRSSRKVLLLDEPFGALDARVRKELRALAAPAARRDARHQRVRDARPGGSAR